MAPANNLFHVVNRGNDKRTVYRKAEHYRLFLRLLRKGCGKYPVKVFGHCMMPNHFHLLILPTEDTALSAYMQWVTCRYACLLREQTGTVGYGHVFQRRFWSAPITGTEHFLTVLHYVEANPRRGGLVARAEDWRWSSLAERRGASFGVISELPVPLPSNWCDHVNSELSVEVVEDIRSAISRKRGRPRLDGRLGPPASQ